MESIFCGSSNSCLGAKPLLSATMVLAIREMPSKDDLLQIAEFLTRFQTYYLKEGAKIGTISVNDLEEVLLIRHENNAGTDNWKSSRSDDDIVRLEVIDHLWQRVDVWNAKAIARHLLVTPEAVAIKFHQAESNSLISKHDADVGFSESESSRDDLKKRKPSPKRQKPNTVEEHVAVASHLYFSCLMNLPLLSYTRILLQQSKPEIMEGNASDAPLFAQYYRSERTWLEGKQDALVKVSDKSLALMPNHYNWPHFASITHLLNQLPESIRPNVYNSLYLGGQSMGFGRQVCKQVPRSTALVSDEKFLKADLVGLSIRARRNFEAQRHLIQLFEYEGEGKNTRAIFKGAHKYCARLLKNTKRIVKLQSWAVTNQVRFTSPVVLKYLAGGKSHSETHPISKPTPPEEYVNPSGRKKSRMTNVDGEEPPIFLKQLRQAVERAILREWTRKHARILVGRRDRDQKRVTNDRA